MCDTSRERKSAREALGLSAAAAGQAALRPLASGLTLTKLQAAIPGWKPRSVGDAIADWVASPMEGAKPLGE